MISGNNSIRWTRGIGMTLVASRVKCSKCGKKFFWNPDVGRGNCPRCGKRWTMKDLAVQGLKRGDKWGN